MLKESHGVLVLVEWGIEGSQVRGISLKSKEALRVTWRAWGSGTKGKLAFWLDRARGSGCMCLSRLKQSNWIAVQGGRWSVAACTPTIWQGKNL